MGKYKKIFFDYKKSSNSFGCNNLLKSLGIKKFKNIHKGEDVYIIASGKSLDFIDDSFFVVPLIDAAVNEITDSFILKNWDKSNSHH